MQFDYAILVMVMILITSAIILIKLIYRYDSHYSELFEKKSLFYVN